MPLRCTKPARERILLMGPHGSGKTRMWLTIAKKSEMLKSPGTFYVHDTDMAVRRMLSGEGFESLLPRTQWMRFEAGGMTTKGTWVVDGDVIENPRMVVYEPYEWEEYMTSMEDCNRQITNDDWLVVDLANPAWDAVHDYYVDLVFKKSTTEFYMAARDKRGGALDGDKDWSNINRMYREWAKHLLRLRGHLLICTGVKNVQTEGGRVDPKDVRVTFGPHGVKPEGQKHLPHTVHTILLAKEFKPGDWQVTTVKDRERDKLTGETMNDFVMQYLVPVAGWSMA